MEIKLYCCYSLPLRNFFIKTGLFNKTATKTQKYSINKNNG